MRVDIGNYQKLSRLETFGSMEDVLSKLSLRKFWGKTEKDNRQSRKYFLSNLPSSSTQSSEQFTSVTLELLHTMISDISKNNSISKLKNITFQKEGPLATQND